MKISGSYGDSSAYYSKSNNLYGSDEKVGVSTWLFGSQLSGSASRKDGEDPYYRVDYSRRF